MEAITEGKDDAEGRAIYMGGMMQKEDIMEGRDDAGGGHYGGEG